MAKDQELTPEEKKERAESAYRILKKSKIPQLALAGFIDEENGYGSATRDAVHDHLYLQALQSGDKDIANVTTGSLIQSRAGGKHYTGSINEAHIIQQAQGIVMGNFQALTVNQAMELIGVKNDNLSKKYGGKYLEEVKDVKVKLGDKEVALTNYLVSTYVNYITNEGAEKAHAARKKAVAGGLEHIVTN